MIELTYRCLGHLENKYWYYSYLLQRVIALTPTEHRKENLFNLASLDYWQKEYGDSKGIKWDKAVDSIMRTCAAEGLFNPSDIVGRGIWLINGKGVTHYGDKVLIDGVKYNKLIEIPPDALDKKVFEAAQPLQIGKADITTDFSQVEKLLAELSFQTPHAATLISGWIVCSMAAGALHWRSHGWVTGRSGSGKSAVMKVITTILGNCCEHYVGETTEAGIRQDLRHDCRAIVFDEAEPKNHAVQMQIQKVLNLLRQASSDDTGKIAKGTVTGKGMNFKIRCCGFLGSVNAQLTEEPDINRFFVIEMGKPIDKKVYDKWLYRMENTFTKGFQAALHNRISENIVTFAANAKTFARVLGARFVNNRAGDQYGTLMAGVFLLQSTELVTDAQALMFCVNYKFPPENAIADDKSDENDLLNYLMDRMIPFKKVSGDKILNMDRPLAELIDAAFSNFTPPNYAAKDAEIALADKGIKCVTENDKQYVAFSTSNTALADLINRSRFAGLDWSPILRRILGATSPRKPYRIGQGKKLSKVTLIPWNHHDENTDENSHVIEL